MSKYIIFESSSFEEKYSLNNNDKIIVMITIVIIPIVVRVVLDTHHMLGTARSTLQLILLLLPTIMWDRFHCYHHFRLY